MTLLNNLCKRTWRTYLASRRAQQRISCLTLCMEQEPLYSFIKLAWHRNSTNLWILKGVKGAQKVVKNLQRNEWDQQSG